MQHSDNHEVDASAPPAPGEFTVPQSNLPLPTVSPPGRLWPCWTGAASDITHAQLYFSHPPRSRLD